MREIAISSSAAAVVSSTLATMRRLCPCDAALWLSAGPEGQEVLGWSGLVRPDGPRGGRLPEGEGLSGEALRTGRPVVVADRGSASNRAQSLDPLMDREGLVSAAALPFRTPGGRAGVVAVLTRRRRVFAQSDVDLLAEVVRVAGAVHELNVVRETLEAEATAQTRVTETEAQVRQALESFSEEVLRGTRLETALTVLSGALGAEVFVERSPHLPPGPAEQPVGTWTPRSAARTLRVPGSEAALVKAADPTVPTDDVLHRISLVVGHEIARQREGVETEMRLSEDIVRHLLEGNEAEMQQMWFRGSLAGIDLGIPRAMVWLAEEEPMGPAMLDRLRAAVRTRSPRSHVWVYRGQALAYWAAEGVTTADVRNQVDEVLQACRPLRLAAGVSDICTHARQHPRAVREARFTWQVAQGRTSRRVMSIDELGTFRLFAHVAGVAALREAADECLATLHAQDRRDGSELVATLRAYLEHDRRLAATARALHVHVNTLRYRIERISELLRMDLDDPDERFAVLLALRIGDVVQPS